MTQTTRDSVIAKHKEGDVVSGVVTRKIKGGLLLDTREGLLKGGDTGPAIKPGDRIRVSGRERKEYPSGNRDFLVDKLAKDYGPCKTLPATP